MSGTNKGTPSGSAAKVPGPAVPFLDRTGQVSPIWRAFFWSLGTQLSAVVNGQTIGNDISVLDLAGGLQGTVVGNQLVISSGSEWLYQGETFSPVAAVDVGAGLALDVLQNGTIILTLDTTTSGVDVQSNGQSVVQNSQTINFVGNVSASEAQPNEAVVEVPYLHVSGESEVPLLDPIPLDFTQVTDISFAGNAILQGNKALNYFGSEQFVGYGITTLIPGTVQYDGPALVMEFIAATGNFSNPDPDVIQFAVGTINFSGGAYIQNTGGTLSWNISGVAYQGQATDIQNVFQYGSFGGFTGTSLVGSSLVLPEIIPGDTVGYVFVAVLPEIATSITVESSLGVFEDIGTFTGTSFTQGAVFLSSFASNGTLDATVALGTSTSFGVITGTVLPQYLDTNSGTVTVTVPFTTLSDGTTALTTELLELEIGQGLTGSGSGVTGTIDLSLTALEGTTALGTFYALDGGTNLGASLANGTLTLDAYSQFVDGTSTVDAFGVEAGPNVDFLASGNFAEIYIEPAFGLPVLQEGTLTILDAGFISLGSGFTMTALSTVPPVLGSYGSAGYLGGVKLTRSLAGSSIIGFAPNANTTSTNMTAASVPAIWVGTFFGLPYTLASGSGSGPNFVAEVTGNPTFDAFTPVVNGTTASTSFVNSGSLDQLVLFYDHAPSTFNGTITVTGADLLGAIAVEAYSTDGGFFAQTSLTPGQTATVEWVSDGVWTTGAYAILESPLQGVLLESSGGGGGGLVFVDGTSSVSGTTLSAGGNIAFTGTSPNVTIDATAGATLSVISGTTTATDVSAFVLGANLALTTGTSAGTVTVSGEATVSANLTFEQNGTSIGTAGTIDFLSGLSATVAGGVASVSSTGGGGGGKPTLVQSASQAFGSSGGTISFATPPSAGHDIIIVVIGSGTLHQGDLNVVSSDQNCFLVKNSYAQGGSSAPIEYESYSIWRSQGNGTLNSFAFAASDYQVAYAFEFGGFVEATGQVIGNTLNLTTFSQYFPIENPNAYEVAIVETDTGNISLTGSLGFSSTIFDNFPNSAGGNYHAAAVFGLPTVAETCSVTFSGAYNIAIGLILSVKAV